MYVWRRSTPYRRRLGHVRLEPAQCTDESGRSLTREVGFDSHSSILVVARCDIVPLGSRSRVHGQRNGCLDSMRSCLAFFDQLELVNVLCMVDKVQHSECQRCDELLLNNIHVSVKGVIQLYVALQQTCGNVCLTSCKLKRLCNA